MIGALTDAILTRPGGIASLVALVTSCLLFVPVIWVDSDLGPIRDEKRPKPILSDGDRYLLIHHADQAAHIATFRETDREAIGIALWNVSIAVPDANVTYNGVALLRHDRIDWRFFIEFWVNPKPLELVTDLLEDERVCLQTCFYMFHSHRHQLIPLSYAHVYMESIRPKTSFQK